MEAHKLIDHEKNSTAAGAADTTEKTGWFKRFAEFLESVWFGSPQSKTARTVVNLLLFLLFLIGLLHWVGFFHAGRLSLNIADWTMNVAYLTTLRQAQLTGEIPFMWAQAYFHSDLFLGNPEVILTPDIFLLRWLGDGVFFLLHTLLFYTLGFWGSLKLKKRLDTNLMAFLVFWLLFNFNGYITAHIAIGHIPWVGYFLLPLYFVFLMDVLKVQPRQLISRSGIFLALTIALLFWNGSFHLALMALGFTFLVGFFAWKKEVAFHLLKILLLSGLLSMGRLLPSYYLSRSLKYPYITGYPSLTTLVDAFTVLRDYTFERLGGSYGDLGWWEFDIYIGFFAFVLLILAAVFNFKKQDSQIHPALKLAGLTMLLLSLGDSYAIFEQFSIPILTIERVISRFIILPFFVLLLIGLVEWDHFIRSWRPYSRLLIASFIPVIVYNLFSHSWIWRIVQLERNNSYRDHVDIELLSYQAVDPTFRIFVYAGWGISLLAILLTIYLLNKTKSPPLQKPN